MKTAKLKTVMNAAPVSPAEATPCGKYSAEGAAAVFGAVVVVCVVVVVYCMRHVPQKVLFWWWRRWTQKCVSCVRRVLKDKASTCRSDDRPSHGDSSLR
jgi:hypothetical protein